MTGPVGYRAAVQAAHSNYQLTEIHNRLRAEESGESPQARRLGAVHRLIGGEER